MPYHKPSTAPSLRIDPVACLIHVNAFGLVDRGESFATDRQKYPGKCPKFRVNAHGGNAAERVLFRHQMIAE
jgi:hypothetical protein